jgi:NAD(P)-dependent dehydrogenase (short-subunit alcohol dehydrogenase family)
MVRLVEQPFDVWRRHIDVDLTGPFLCARRVLPGMLAAGWGRVVNLSSIWGLIGAKGATAYSAAKGGLVAFTRALQAEVGGRGVVVTAIAPGIIDTPQLSADAAFAGITLEEMRARYATQNLVGRIGTPEEIAGVVAFLASDDAQVFGGQTIPVTGGRSE